MIRLISLPPQVLSGILSGGILNEETGSESIYFRNIAPPVDLRFTAFGINEPYIKTTALDIASFLMSFFISPRERRHREKLRVKNNKRESSHAQSAAACLRRSISGSTRDRKRSKS
jgi:hypothetical protein